MIFKNLDILVKMVAWELYGKYRQKIFIRGLVAVWIKSENSYQTVFSIENAKSKFRSTSENVCKRRKSKF